MSLEQRPRPIFETKSVYPEGMDPEEQVQLWMEAQERLQKIAIATAGKQEVVKSITVDHPMKVYVIGDLHFGHIASAHEEIIALRENILGNPYAGVVFVGDEIEGFTTKYPATSGSQTHATAQQQVDMIKTLLFKPLAEEGRVLGIVSDYFGHPGWLNDASTLNPWKLMADIASLESELKELADKKIEIIGNGGILRLEFPDGQWQSLRIHHNPPGKSKIDPLYGLRIEAIEESVELRPNGSTSGHFHKAGIAKELYAGSDVPFFMISSGTTKGSSPSKPRDLFGVRIGANLADPIGQGVIISPRHRGDKFDRSYPFMSFDQGEIAHKAIELLDQAEKNKLTEELLGQIKSPQRKPEVTLLKKDSQVIEARSPYNEKIREEKERKDKERKEGSAKGGGNGNGYDKQPERYPMNLSPVYDALTYNVETDLPIALHLISNARIGSTVEGINPLHDYQNNFIRNNPHSLVVYLRNMIDKEIAKDANRIKVLDKMVKLIHPIQDQVIALLLDQNLRSNDWDRDVDDQLRFPPGSYLSNKTDTPLIHHLSYIKIAVGPKGSKLADKPLYIGAFADHLEKHGSQDKPTFGLMQLYKKKLPSKPGYVAGGHMPNSGTMMFYHTSNSETNYPALIAPGWWSNYVDTIGAGNVKLGSLPGQAIIFMPGTTKADYMVFPTANADETKYMHDGLLLLKGLGLLGLNINDVISRK